MKKKITSGEIVIGLERVRRGKVRDTYQIRPENQIDDVPRMLVVASDRISVFDFVLNAQVEDKGEILTALNIFWRLELRGYLHDLAAYGSVIDQYLPSHLCSKPEIQKRAVVVNTLKMLPIECIVRGYLTGSGLSAYRKDGTVCGHVLPHGLHDGSKLPEPIFTPTTKAEVGHDEHITAQSVREQYGNKPEMLSLRLYSDASRVAASRRLIIADTKIELSADCIGDEVLTPDSSRFWDCGEYEHFQKLGQSPPAHDKQFVREYAKSLGIDKRDPKNPSDYEWVRAQRIDPWVLLKTAEIYHGIFLRLTGMTLKKFQQDVLCITA